ncbi:unnamed protein product, partial [Symbiodinium sp. KB8]
APRKNAAEAAATGGAGGTSEGEAAEPQDVLTFVTASTEGSASVADNSQASAVPPGFVEAQVVVRTPHAAVALDTARALVDAAHAARPAGVPLVAVFDIDDTLICSNDRINTPMLQLLRGKWTVEQLQRAGIPPAMYNALYLCPAHARDTAPAVTAWKAAARARVAADAAKWAQGIHGVMGDASEQSSDAVPVALSVGDQWWDVMPNPTHEEAARLAAAGEAFQPVPYLRSGLRASVDEYCLVRVNDGITLFGLKLPEFHALSADHPSFGMRVPPPPFPPAQ